MMRIAIEKNKKQIIDLLRSTGRKGIDKFIKRLEESDFFEAPASAKYHLNDPGGLAHHSLKVYETFDRLIAIFWKGKYIHPSTRIICALLHDVCKIDIYSKKFEISHPEGELAERIWAGEYEREDNYPIGHGEKSVIWILNNGLELTKEEILIIRWHMAMYDQSYYRNSNDIQRVCPQAKLLYFADDISTQYLESE